jgi:hypothetical protein
VQTYARESARTAARSGTDDPADPQDVDDLRQRLDGRTWVQLRRVGDRLRALVVDARRAEVLDLGSATAAVRESLFLRSALGRHMTVVTPATAQQVASSAERLERHVLSPLRLGDDPIVLRPVTELRATPWAALPGLVEVPFTVVPPAVRWRSALQRTVRTHAKVVLVAGPGLEHAETEVAAVGRHHAAARVLVGASATVAAVVAAIDGADLVHLACHGQTARNPTLSSLLFQDGHMFGRDIARVAVGPGLVVLSSCHGGLATGCAPRAVGALASLLAIGTSTAIAATVPVPDRADTVEAMACLHERLTRGERPDEALAAVRRSSSCVARAFSCVGAG